MSAVVYVNGVIRSGAEATVPVFDHGFLYGEGVYETLRTYGRRPFLFDRHAVRLSCLHPLARNDPHRLVVYLLDLGPCRRVFGELWIFAGAGGGIVS